MWLSLTRLWVCDYQIPSSEELDCLILVAESLEVAEQKAIEELKTLNIPKRYLLNVEEVI